MFKSIEWEILIQKVGVSSMVPRVLQKLPDKQGFLQTTSRWNTAEVASVSGLTQPSSSAARLPLRERCSNSPQREAPEIQPLLGMLIALSTRSN